MLFFSNLISLHNRNAPYLNNYGYGWCINKSSEGGNIIYHQGNISGYTSFIARNIDKKYLLIILSNKDNDSYAVNTIPLRLSQILENK